MSKLYFHKQKMFFHTLEDIVSPRKKHPEELVYLGNKEIY